MGSTRDTLKRRVRKTVKWGGAGLTVLLVVVWIGSTSYNAGWRLPASKTILVKAGQVCYFGLEPPVGQIYYIVVGYDEVPFSLNWWFDWGPTPFGPFFFMPLWPAVLLSLLATAAAWRADAKYLRRVREGACPACGYDRAGLAAISVCPECGAAPSV